MISLKSVKNSMDEIYLLNNTDFGCDLPCSIRYMTKSRKIINQKSFVNCECDWWLLFDVTIFKSFVNIFYRSSLTHMLLSNSMISFLLFLLMFCSHVYSILYCIQLSNFAGHFVQFGVVCFFSQASFSCIKQ